MDATHWPKAKEIVGLIKPVSFSSSPSYCSTSIEEMMMVTQLPYSCTSSAASGYTRTPLLMERRTRPNGKEQGATLPCPRCKSTNTKFCYYNNYSLTQPRYFCKACRRYWTQGGSLRNVPVGGRSRKNKKSTTTSTTPSSPAPSSSTSTTFMKNLLDMTSTQVRNPGLHEGKALGLSSFYVNNNSIINPFLLPLQESAGPTSDGFGLQCLLSNSVDFPMVTTKFQEDDGRRVFFPSENLIQVTQVTDQNRGRQGSDHKSSGFWNGLIGGINTSW